VQSCQTPIFGVADRGRYNGCLAVVDLIVQGRDFVVDVAEVPDGCPKLVGQLPLEALDWVIDPIGQRLIGNARG